MLSRANTRNRGSAQEEISGFVSCGILEHLFEQLPEYLAENGPRPEPECLEVLAADREVSDAERCARSDDAFDVRLERFEAREILRSVTPLREDVGAIELVKRRQNFLADSAKPAPDGCVRPTGLVTNQMVPNEMDDSLAFIVRKAKPFE